MARASHDPGPPAMDPLGAAIAGGLAQLRDNAAGALGRLGGEIQRRLGSGSATAAGSRGRLAAAQSPPCTWQWHLQTARPRSVRFPGPLGSISASSGSASQPAEARPVPKLVKAPSMRAASMGGKEGGAGGGKEEPEDRILISEVRATTRRTGGGGGAPAG
jgi:hypothetical protein